MNSRWWVLGAWLLVLALLGIAVVTHLRISTDLRAFMPPARTAQQRLLLNEIGQGPGSRLLMLSIRGAAVTRLAELSQQLATVMRADSRFTRVLNGENTLVSIAPSLLPYRYLLSPALDHQRLDASYLHAQLQQRLEDLGSPAAGLLKPLLPSDPTLQTLQLAERWKPVAAPRLQHGVWFAHGRALLLVETRAGGFDIAAQRRTMAAVRAHFAALPDVGKARLELAGTGPIAVAVDARTRHESDIIGLVDMLGFLALLLLAYRSFASIGLIALPILSAALAGLAALELGFSSVHGITLAFGFTLLGIAQEYPIRVLSQRRAGEDPLPSVRALWPTLRIAIASAAIAFLAFFASSVPGLQQLAVFTITGLLVAGLCTRYLLPPLLPRHFHDAVDTPGLASLARWLRGLPRPRWLPWLLLLAGGLTVGLAPGPFWQNNLAALTPAPQGLLQRDARLRAALGAPDVRYLLVLQAPTAQAVLSLSEHIAPLVRALEHQGAVRSVSLPSRYLPSVATQRARQARLPDRSQLQAALQQAERGLPFRAGLFQPFVQAVERARQLPPMTPAMFEKTPFGPLLSSILVQRGTVWYGLATLSGLRDTHAFEGLRQASHGAVRLLDLKAASESLVAAYRTRILQALLVATLLLGMVVAVGLRSLRGAVQVLTPMLLATFLVLAVLRGAGVALNLFHLVALMLAAGLGLHYALFFHRDPEDPRDRLRTLHATLMCVLTALLVFGMLAWSSLPVLRAIGVSVGLGVLFHFCLSLLLARPHTESTEQKP